jgi:hypothetical protein
MAPAAVALATRWSEAVGMDASPTPRSENAGPWVDFAALAKNVKAQMRALRYFPSEGGVFESLTQRHLQGIYGTQAKMAKMVGASMSFQDTSPADKPGHSARYRLEMDGRAPVVFENLQEFNEWTRKNMSTLMAWAERSRLGAAAPAPKSSSSSRRPRAL